LGHVILPEVAAKSAAIPHDQRCPWHHRRPGAAAMTWA